MRYHFQNSERKECCSDFDHHVADFRISFCITFLNYWMGIRLNTEETILYKMARAFLVIHLVMLATISSVLDSFDSSCSCKYWLSAFPMLSYNMAKNKYMPHLFMEKGITLATPTLSNSGF